MAWLLYQVPAVNSRLAWRLDSAWAYARGVIDPVGAVPTAAPQPTRLASSTPRPTATPSSTPTSPAASPTPTATLTPSPSPTPRPATVSLPAPEWEKQGWNNCGPATLALYLRTHGWEGDQYDISTLVKPQPSDRNVNVEELISYVWNEVPGIDARFRVGGDLELLRSFLAAGLPVMIEEGMDLDQSYWPNDDLWAGHYLLLTGYDDTTSEFETQDTFYGAEQRVPYDALDQHWQVFNRVYILVFRPDQEALIDSLLGPHLDFDYNRQHALEVAQAEIDADPENAFAWFNLGSNLVYFERYEEAAEVYDRVRELGVPQRMWRYQFSPFMAYFHSGRIDDLMALTEYALKITDLSEEAHLWRGWGYYRQGQIDAAIADFRAALDVNVNYEDAKYALGFLGVEPVGNPPTATAEPTPASSG